MEILPHETICIQDIASHQIENNSEVGIHTHVRSCRVGDFIGEVRRYSFCRITGENTGTIPLISGVDVWRDIAEGFRPYREWTQTRRATAQQIDFLAGGQSYIQCDCQIAVTPEHRIFHSYGDISESGGMPNSSEGALV